MSISRIYGADLNGMSAFMGVEFAATGSGGPTPPPVGERGLFGGGSEEGSPDTQVNTIQKITISTTGNASDFGDLTAARTFLGAVSNGANGRGCFAAGYTDDSVNVIDYVTIASDGDATDFGDMFRRGGSSDYSLTQNVASCSNGTSERGVFAGGVDYWNGGFWNLIQYITINTTGDGSDFGDLLNILEILAGGTSNKTGNRGVFSGGHISMGPQTNIIQYITINSAGNATDFGDLLGPTELGACCSNGTDNRGIYGGGYNTDAGEFNVISYITINTTGDATDFGDLIEGQDYLAATDNSTSGRGVFAGGYQASPYSNTIQYITIGTLGNSANFGDLTNNIRGLAACSNA